MRVLVVTADYPGTKGQYIATAFRRHGHDTRSFDDWNYGLVGKSPLRRVARYILPRFPAAERAVIRGISDPRFLRVVRTYHPDLIFLSRSDRVSAEALARAKSEMGALVVHWFPDAATHAAVRGVLESLPVVDLLFVKDSGLAAELELAGHGNVRYLPQACSVDMHRPIQLSGAERDYYGSDISLASSISPERVELLRALGDFDVKVWCEHPWLQLNGARNLPVRVMRHRAFGEEQTKVFSAAKITLNLHRKAEVNGLNLRTFEAAGCGAFQLVDRRKDLARSFEEGREIVCFESRAHLAELASYYLKNDGERRAIAERAMRRAHAEHTYEHRVATILSELGVSAATS